MKGRVAGELLDSLTLFPNKLIEMHDCDI